MMRVTQPDTWSCMAAVAAMIAGETLQDVYNFLGHDGSGYDEKSNHPEKRTGFRFEEVFRYLIERGITLGVYACIGSDWHKPEGCAGEELAKLEKIDLPVYLSWPALVSVKSERLAGCKHVIYWDGKVAHDPNPEAPPDRPLSDYYVYGLWPVMRFE